MEPPPNETRRCFFAFAFALTDGKPRDIRRGFPSTPCPFGDTSELEASTSLPILVSEGFRLAVDKEGDSFTRDDGGDLEVPFNESSIGRRRGGGAALGGADGLKLSLNEQENVKEDSL